MAVKFGRAKHGPEITLADILRHPIWVSAHDERHDEEWEKPVVSPASVTRDVLRVNNPLITLRLEGTQLFGSGYYDHANRRIYGISLWIEGEGILVEHTKGLRFPMTFVAIPPILRQRDVRFVLRKAKDYFALRST